MTVVTSKELPMLERSFFICSWFIENFSYNIEVEKTWGYSRDLFSLHQFIVTR